jgi:DNA-directed RNA polymerase specialized sigma24 family protein
MVIALYQSGILDGITRGVRARWSRLSPDEVDDVVAAGVAGLYVAVHGGKKVLDVGAYLWKAINYQAADAHRLGQIEQHCDSASVQEYAECLWDYGDAGEVRRDELRAQAIGIARTLLPQLGQANVRAVMEFVIDAVEAGDIHVSNQEIADALGLPPHSVRTLLSRGFQRLQRVVRKAGLISLERELTSIGQERTDEIDEIDEVSPFDDQEQLYRRTQPTNQPNEGEW